MSRGGRAVAELALRGGVARLPGWERDRPFCLAVVGGRIVYAGPESGLGEWTGPRTEVLDLAGRVLAPGFCDAHVHPIMGGLMRIECDLSQAEGREGCLAALARYVAAHSDAAVIRGGGWQDGAFGPLGPDRRDLDAVESARPVLLASVDQHSLWVNSRALALAGITAATPDPAGGRIERDPAGGEPRGALREWSAMRLVQDRVPAPGQSELEAAGRAYFELAAREGITCVHDPMVGLSHLETYAALLESGEPLPHLSASVLCEPEQGPSAVDKALTLRRRFDREGLRVRSAKLFLDGVVEAHTAALAEPYADRPGFRGEPLWERESFLAMAAALDREGFQLHLHAIGDGAIRLALDGFEAAAGRNGRRDARHQIAHLDLVGPAEIARLAALRATANVQPAWFYEDSVYSRTILPALGPERAGRLYPLRDLLAAGVPVACGSDWPAAGGFVSLRPLDAVRIGATRLGIGDGSGRPLNPGQRVGVSALLEAYTRGGAWAAFLEHETGALVPGMWADAVVLDQDPLAIPAGEVHTVRVLLTLRRGRAAYRDPAL